MTETKKKPAKGWWNSRRAALITVLVVGLVVAGGVSAWAVGGSGNSGFRLGSVVRASLNNSLNLVGTVEPVSNASPAFQVGGKVSSVSAAVGQTVTVGQTLATLDTTALSETVSSDQSSLDSARAKLTEDEESQTSSSSHATTTTTTPSKSTTTSTTTPSSSTDTATITADQNQLTSDEAQTSTDQQQEAADLTQAETDCGTGTGTGGSGSGGTGSGSTAACTTDLAQVNTDQQKVAADEQTVAKDEQALAKVLNDSGSGSGSGTDGGTGTNSGSPTGGGTPSGGSAPSGGSTSQDAHALSAGSPTSSNTSPSGSGGNGDTGSSAASDTPEQIATDQANIDSADADLIEAQQALSEATLTSPINGTIASVGITAGDTVSAGSSTEVIVIVGTQSYAVSATLSSSQVPSVKVGQTADVAVDGQNGVDTATVSQVGPVEDTSDGYSYPVVVTLPASVSGLFAGSTANMTITTGGVSNVIAVPTSAVNTLNTRVYVDMLKNGQLMRKIIKVGMVGTIYTQVLSGLTPGESVVLADLAEPVPSSNTDTLGGGFGGFGGGGFGGGGGGGGASFRINFSGGKGVASISPAGG